MESILQPKFDRREFRGPSSNLYDIYLDQFKRFLNKVFVDVRQRTSEVDDMTERVRLFRIFFIQIFF